jgi:hypothetical protein
MSFEQSVLLKLMKAVRAVGLDAIVIGNGCQSPIQSFMTRWSFRRVTPGISSNPHCS